LAKKAKVGFNGDDGWECGWLGGGGFGVGWGLGGWGLGFGDLVPGGGERKNEQVTQALWHAREERKKRKPGDQKCERKD